MECILFLAARVCSSLKTDVLYTVVALGWCSIAMSNIVHMALHVAVFFFVFFFFTQLPGPDNRGSIVLSFVLYVWLPHKHYYVALYHAAYTQATRDCHTCT